MLTFLVLKDKEHFSEWWIFRKRLILCSFVAIICFRRLRKMYFLSVYRAAHSLHNNSITLAVIAAIAVTV